METGDTSNPEQDLELGSRADQATFESDLHSDFISLQTLGNMQSVVAPLGTSDESILLKNDFYEDCIPKFYETMPTLQEISSVVVAVALWGQKINLPHNSCLGYLPIPIYVEVEKLLQELPVPRLIQEIIKTSLACVRKEIVFWFRYYKQNILTSRRGTGEGTMKVGDLLFCYWLPNGKIDHKKSALNMLTNTRLMQVDKFRIICTYCLVDEIEKFSANSLPSYFVESVDFNSNALIYYWLCYMKADLDKIPNSSDESIASCMITAPGVDTWSAIEYFWNLLSVEEQTSKVEQILDRRPEFQMKIFNKMSDTQKFHLFSKIPMKIMKNFWNIPGQVRYAFSTWIYIRNFVDYQQLEQLMKAFAWDISFNIEEKVKCLVDISNHCPDHFKSVVFQPAIMDIIIDIHRFGVCPSALGDKQIIIDYMYFASAELRKKIVIERADVLVSLLDPVFTDQLIKLCLPNAHDVIKLKKYALESDFIQHRLCQKLHDREFQILNWFFEYYCPDSCARSEYCAKILEMLDIGLCRFQNAKDWINVMEFIDENLLLALPLKALKFKKRVAFSFALFICEIWSEDEKVGKMIEIVDQLLVAEELAKFKVNALSRVQGGYKWAKFDENVIGGFLLWCCNDDDQKVREFKKTLSIRLIFNNVWYSIKLNRILQYDVDYETVCGICEPLDKFLHWYFENPADVKIFKLARVYDEGTNYVSVFPRKGYSNKDVFSRNTLPWFFDGDQDAVESFKKMCMNGSLRR